MPGTRNIRDQLPPSSLSPSYLETEESLRHHLAVVRLLPSAEKHGMVPVTVLVSTQRVRMNIVVVIILRLTC